MSLELPDIDFPFAGKGKQTSIKNTPDLWGEKK